MENQSGAFSRNCEKCGKTLYDGEMLNIKGKYVCEPCADYFIFASPGASYKRRSMPSPFFHFLFSFHPGAGQMYLGFMRRGLFHMCLFYLCIYMSAVSMSGFFAFTIPIVYFYSFFDSLVLRRRLAAGEVVPDSIGGVAAFLSGNKWLVLAVIVLMLAASAFSAILGFVGIRRGMQHSVSYSIERSIEEPVERAVAEANTIQIYGNSPNGPTGIYINGGRHMNLFAPIALISIGMLIVLKSVRHKKRASAVKTVEYLDGDDNFN